MSLWRYELRSPSAPVSARFCCIRITLTHVNFERLSRVMGELFGLKISDGRRQHQTALYRLHGGGAGRDYRRNPQGECRRVR
jgi:hypothetical protein